MCFKRLLYLISVVLILVVMVLEPAQGADLFGFTLDTGSGKTGSLLKSQGYNPQVKQNLTYPRITSLELFGYTNDYLKDMQLWVEFYTHRSYIYKWEGVINADKPSTTNINRFLKHLVSIFGHPRDYNGNKTKDSIKLSTLKAVTRGEEDLSFIWKNKKDQIELFLGAPLFATTDTEIELTLRYFSPETEQKVMAYQNGK